MRAGRTVDEPRTGLILWLLLATLLLPALAVGLGGRLFSPIEHQRLWVFLLALPAPLALLSLPRWLILDDQHLSIHGLFYRTRVALADIVLVERISAGQALVSLGSWFCSDPMRAIRIRTKQGRRLVISPTKPEPFLALSVLAASARSESP